MIVFFDLPLDQLQDYRPQVAEPKDFDHFWKETLEQNPFDPNSVVIEPIDRGFADIEVSDVTFGGYGNAPIKAWLLRPASASSSSPIVVHYVGYGGGRGLPEEHLFWPSRGVPVLVMDTRGQGGNHGTGGATRDPEGGGPAVVGPMTSGIEDPYGYYYRRVFTDAHHAVEVAAGLPDIDPKRIAVIGGSQGGAMAMAASALNPRVAMAMVDVPFLCYFERAVGLASQGPYQDVVTFLSVRRDLVEKVFNTLSYFDGVSMAKRATCDAMFSTGLMDVVCPPSTVFAAKNQWGGDATIKVYPYNSHEGGSTYQLCRQGDWLTSRWLGPSEE